ncbi:unnamed protein product [Closterium sp. NIES-65]|nr:unnamed protein product [Closterium sp. NIES-65]
MASRLAILIAVLAMAAAAHAAKPAAKPYPQDLKGLCTKGGCDYTSGSFDYWTVSTITPTSRLSIPCASWQNRLALPLVPVSGPDFLPLMARAHFLLPPSASSRLPHAQIPEYGACVSSPPSSSKPYCAAGSIHAKACCNKCSNTTGTTSFNCRFWVHIPTLHCPSQYQVILFLFPNPPFAFAFPLVISPFAFKPYRCLSSTHNSLLSRFLSFPSCVDSTPRPLVDPPEEAPTLAPESLAASASCSPQSTASSP